MKKGEGRVKVGGGKWERGMGMVCNNWNDIKSSDHGNYNTTHEHCLWYGHRVIFDRWLD